MDEAHVVLPTPPLPARKSSRVAEWRTAALGCPRPVLGTGEGACPPRLHALIAATESNGVHDRSASTTGTPRELRASASRFSCARQVSQSQSCAARSRMASGTSIPSRRTSSMRRRVCSTTHASERKTGMNALRAASVSSPRRRLALFSKSSMNASMASLTLRRVNCRTSWRRFACIDSRAAPN